MGDGPRYFGNSEGWTLIVPCRACSNTSFGIIFPYDTTTRKSNEPVISFVLGFCGWINGTLCSIAQRFVGGGVISRFLPAGLSGLQIIRLGISPAANSISSVGTAKGSPPKNAKFNVDIVLLWKFFPHILGVIDKEYTIQVICLMLKNLGQQPRGAAGKLFTVFVIRSYGCLF